MRGFVAIFVLLTVAIPVCFANYCHLNFILLSVAGILTVAIFFFVIFADNIKKKKFK